MKGLKQSEQALDPLSGLAIKDRKAFENSLTTKEKQYLKLANDYYKETIDNKTQSVPKIPVKKVDK